MDCYVCDSHFLAMTNITIFLCFLKLNFLKTQSHNFSIIFAPNVFFNYILLKKAVTNITIYICFFR